MYCFISYSAYPMLTQQKGGDHVTDSGGRSSPCNQFEPLLCLSQVVFLSKTFQYAAGGQRAHWRQFGGMIVSLNMPLGDCECSVVYLHQSVDLCVNVV